MRFNQIFVLLLLLSFISAFFLPAGITNRARNLQALFYPIARPARAIGGAFSDRFTPPAKDDRAVTDVRAENEQLRLMVSSLTAELHGFQRLNADRQLIGDLRAYCTPVRVVGGDPGKRQSLSLKGGSMDGIRPGMAVLSRKGLVGRIERSGPGGSQVQLITDSAFRAIGQFRRFERDATTGEARYTPYGQTAPMVIGGGDGTMSIVNVPLKETRESDVGDKAVRVGDLVVLNDPEWEHVGGRWLGQIESIEPVKLFAMITVRPALDLAGLREVLVMNKRAEGSGFRVQEKPPP
ncbi:MAG: rod shape-determining protein MreC [Tepidisphaeraceae bacterium]